LSLFIPSPFLPLFVSLLASHILCFLVSLFVSLSLFLSFFVSFFLFLFISYSPFLALFILLSSVSYLLSFPFSYFLFPSLFLLSFTQQSEQYAKMVLNYIIHRIHWLHYFWERIPCFEPAVLCETRVKKIVHLYSYLHITNTNGPSIGSSKRRACHHCRAEW